MLSVRLVQLIETQWQEIADRLIRQVRTHPDTRQLAAQPDIELRSWCREILENLGYLLAARQETEVERRFRLLGRKRFEENIPLHEAVLRLQLLKVEILGFAHEQGFEATALDLYCAEELRQRVGRFFDFMVYQVVRGYEEAQGLAGRVA